MKHLKITSLLLLACTGCAHPAHTPVAPPGPFVTNTPIKPASIVLDPSTGWSAAPTAPHMPLFVDTPTVLEFYPLVMQGSLIIQRRGGPDGDTGFLDGKVTVPTDATLYMAIRVSINDQTLITPAQLAELGHEGWTHIPGIFGISEPPGITSQWQVWSHSVPPGPVTLTSKILPDGGLFFIGRVR